jgi:hypothetical protein
MKPGEEEREELITRNSSGKVRVARLGGFWWEDNWITPALAYRISPLEELSEVFVEGWNPDISGMENNQFWIGLQNRSHSSSRLLRGRTFEFRIPIMGTPFKPFDLTIATLSELEGDKQDIRSRGCHLYQIKFR